MKNKQFPLFSALLLGCVIAQAAPLGTAFTYQGRLDEGGQPANGYYDMTFWLYAGPIGGSVLASNIVADVPVNDGLFTRSVDFGAIHFTGEERWLAITVATNTSSAFVLLQPRSRLAPAPHAIYATTAGTVTNGAIRVSQLGTTGAAPGSGQVLGYNGSSLAWLPPGGVMSVWTLNGSSAYYNAGRVGVGTDTPGQLLQLGDVEIQGSQGLIRLASRSTNGAYSRTWDVGVPEGGNSDGDGRNYSFVIDDISLGTTPELIVRYGSGNVGIGKTSPQAPLDVNGPILSGEGNTLSGVWATVAGGKGNIASGNAATVSGGRGNTASGSHSMVPGGLFNASSGFASFAAGYGAQALHSGSFVWADSEEDEFGIPVPFESTDAKQFCVRASGGVRFETQFLQVSGTGDERAYLGGDGGGGDVQLGSMNAGVNNVVLYNVGNNTYMNLGARDVSCRVLTIYGGADLAEPFPVKEEKIEKGSVLIIDDEHPGRLKRSVKAYDTRVAGIVSGANGINPGIALKQEGVLDQGENVALTGRVYVQADASFGAIKPGDLLTTSDTPGHAMKVTDHTRAQGAVLGKAMSALSEGTGLVLVLVTLQ